MGKILDKVWILQYSSMGGRGEFYKEAFSNNSVAAKVAFKMSGDWEGYELIEGEGELIDGERVIVNDRVFSFNDTTEKGSFVQSGLDKLTEYEREAVKGYFRNRTITVERAVHVMNENIEHVGIDMIGIMNKMFGLDSEGRGTIAGKYSLKCPNKHEIPVGVIEGDKCPECSGVVSMNELLSIHDMWKAVSHE